MPARRTLVYHITAIDNLAGIVEQGGLWAKSAQAEADLTYRSIAHEGIQDSRSTRVVPCGPGGVLHDYVPFYFGTRSPMLFAIHHGRVQGYNDGQRRIAFLVSSVESVQDQGLPFVFTDGHAVIAFSAFFESANDLDKVDWEIMRARYFNDTVTDNDRKRRRQAEFLVHRFAPLSCLLGVGVYGPEEEAEVREIVGGAIPPEHVLERRHFYC